MNKHSIRDFLGLALSAHASSFKATSYDAENDEYLCQDDSTSHVYDFDAYVREKYDRQAVPASPDAIHLGSKHLYFVEFKNRPARLIDKVNMRRKFIKGTHILRNMLSEFTPRDCKYNFCVVIKSQKKPRYFDSRHIEQNAVQFGLDALNVDCDHFYNQIVIEDVRFFAQQFKELRC